MRAVPAGLALLSLALQGATTAEPAARAVLVDASQIVPSLRVDLRYASSENFLGRAVYSKGARCLLLAPVAKRLRAAAALLQEDGLVLVAWDCYRPLSVQHEMWKFFPKPGYVADPKKGSNHNRGAAVDVSIVAADGTPVPVPTPFDEFSPRAHDGATDGVSPQARRNAQRLKAAMEAAGFRVNPMEWWHFDAPERKGAPVRDEPL